jgi:hypothetical protein
LDSCLLEKEGDRNEIKLIDKRKGECNFVSEANRFGTAARRRWESRRMISTFFISALDVFHTSGWVGPNAVLDLVDKIKVCSPCWEWNLGSFVI